MKDYLNIGSSPHGEDCAQVGSSDYPQKSRLECQAFKNQLLRIFGTPPGGASLVIKSFPHDFGQYREVCVVYDDESEEETDYAFKLESEGPENWDEKAKEELHVA